MHLADLNYSCAVGTGSEQGLRWGEQLEISHAGEGPPGGQHEQGGLTREGCYRNACWIPLLLHYAAWPAAATQAGLGLASPVHPLPKRDRLQSMRPAESGAVATAVRRMRIASRLRGVPRAGEGPSA